MYSTLYWLTRLDAINGLIASFCFATLLASLALFLFSYLSFDEEVKHIERAKKWAKRLIIYCCVFSVIFVFIPSEKDAILIIAGGKTYEYIQADTSLQKLPFKTTEYLKTVLEQEIKEAKQELDK